MKMMEKVETVQLLKYLKNRYGEDESLEMFFGILGSHTLIDDFRKSKYYKITE